MKKKFLPAELREWGDRWMIVFHQIDPNSKKRVRFARSFELNRIKAKTARRKRANEIIKELNNDWLPQGYPFIEPVEHSDLETTNVIDAINFAAGTKTVGRAATTSTYRYTANKFIDFLEKKRMNKMSIVNVTPKVARAYLDWLIVDQKLSNVSHNNLASKTKTLMDVLIDREYLPKGSNPFNGYKKLMEEEKERRPLSSEEKKILSDYIKKNDTRLYLAVNIMYYCFLRKTEILKLKFRFIDFKTGVIRFPGTRSKNKKSEMVTIPEPLTKLLKEHDFHKYPGHWLCFGQGFNPHASKTCSKNTPTLRHRKLVDKLGKLGKLTDIQGIHFYSWKDTGVLNMINKGLDIRRIQNQLRHSSLEVTQKYLKKIYDVIPEIREMESDI